MTNHVCLIAVPKTEEGQPATQTPLEAGSGGQ
jgi:hypothetical protein